MVLYQVAFALAHGGTRLAPSVVRMFGEVSSGQECGRKGDG